MHNVSTYPSKIFGLFGYIFLFFWGLSGLFGEAGIVVPHSLFLAFYFFRLSLTSDITLYSLGSPYSLSISLFFLICLKRQESRSTPVVQPKS